MVQSRQGQANGATFFGGKWNISVFDSSIWLARKTILGTVATHDNTHKALNDSARRLPLMIVLALAVLYFGSAAILGAIPVNGDFAPDPVGVQLCVRSNGVHSDFVVPATSNVIDWRSQHPPSHFPAMHRERPYIAYGWGDRAVYLETPTWADLRSGTALVAVTGMGSAALHVEYLDSPGAGERIACTRISEAQYRRVASYIGRTFKRDTNGAVVRIAAPGYGTSDAFYEAHGAYSLVRTCNEWVRDGLSESGIRAPVWSPFDGALLRQLRAVSAPSP